MKMSCKKVLSNDSPVLKVSLEVDESDPEDEFDKTASESTSGQWARSAENWTITFCEFQQHPFRDMVPNSLWTVLINRIPLLFRTRTHK